MGLLLFFCGFRFTFIPMHLEIPARNFLHYRNLVLSSAAVLYIGLKSWNNWQAGNVLTPLAIILLLFLLPNTYIIFNSIRQLLKRSPAMVLTDEGIKERVSPSNMPIIPWNIIAECEVRRYRGYPHLLITTTDNQQALTNARFYNKLLIKKAIKDTGAAIFVNCDMVDYDREQLVDIIMEKIGKPRIDRHLVSE